MRMLRWGCLLIGALLANPAWADGCHLVSYGTLPVEMIGGRATTMVKINGTDTRFILDTGAFFDTMSRANALALGLHLQAAPFDYRLRGIGGGAASVQFGEAKEFGILGTSLHRIQFIVGGTDTGYGLLGANLLDFADVEIDLAHGKLTLFDGEQCRKSPIAYWSTSGYNVVDTQASYNQNDKRTFLDVVINGKKVRALLDSGAYATVLSRRAAERIGIDLNAPDVKVGGVSSGIGSHLVKTWTVSIDSFSVGTETIQHSQMEVIDGNMGDSETDMLLGVDFLLAHHMFIANSQRKAYFTYNGGRVFSMAKSTSDSDKADADAATDHNSTTPKTASDYALSGEAHLSRDEPMAALADLNEAIHMAPDQGTYYFARARAYLANKQQDAALADLDKCLSLDPKNIDGLMLRAELRAVHKDQSGATADVTAASALAAAGSTQALLLASLYIRLKQPAAALPMLDEWIHLHGDDAKLGQALNARCWARSLSNQMLDDALSDCRKAIKRDGEKPAYLDSLGLVQLRLGHYGDSIKAYQEAVALMPRSGWSRYGLGLAEIHNGQTDAGQADLVAARALDPKIDARATKYGLTAAGP